MVSLGERGITWTINLAWNYIMREQLDLNPFPGTMLTVKACLLAEKQCSLVESDMDF